MFTGSTCASHSQSQHEPRADVSARAILRLPRQLARSQPFDSSIHRLPLPTVRFSGHASANLAQSRCSFRPVALELTLSLLAAAESGSSSAVAVSTEALIHNRNSLWDALINSSLDKQYALYLNVEPRLFLAGLMTTQIFSDTSCLSFGAEHSP